jgi:hypothetical protein
MEKIRKIIIEGVANGILVKIGCLAPLVYGQLELDLFIADLKAYLTNPEATKKIIFERWGIKEELNPANAPLERALPVSEERYVR